MEEFTLLEITHFVGSKLFEVLEPVFYVGLFGYLGYWFYAYMFTNGKVVDGLVLDWDGGSLANPTKKGYIEGYQWTTPEILKSLSEKNIATEDYIIFDKFKYHPDYIKKAKLPKFIVNKNENIEVAFDSLSTAESVLFIGAAGSGKSIWNKNIIAQNWYTKAIIFSKKMDTEQHFLRLNQDYMLSPKISMGCIHDILSEPIEYIEIYIKTILNSVIGSKVDFFSGKAGERIQLVLERVKIKAEDDNSTIKQKWQMFLEFMEIEITAAEKSDRKSDGDVMATAETILPLLYLAAYRIENGAQTFTAKEFFYSNDVPNQRLFLTGTDSTMVALLAATIAVLIKFQLSMKDVKDWNPSYRVYWSLDEYLGLDKIIDSELLNELSREARSKGAHPFKGIQYVNAADKLKTQALMSSVNYVVIFSTVDDDTLNMIIKEAKKIKYKHEVINTSVNDKGDKTYNKSTKIEENNVLSGYLLQTLQKHDYAHITFLPKKDILYMASTDYVDYPKREYLDFSEIDMTDFARWKHARIDKKSKNTNIAASLASIASA